MSGQDRPIPGQSEVAPDNRGPRAARKMPPAATGRPVARVALEYGGRRRRCGAPATNAERAPTAVKPQDVMPPPLVESHPQTCGRLWEPPAHRAKAPSLRSPGYTTGTGQRCGPPHLCAKRRPRRPQRQPPGPRAAARGPPPRSTRRQQFPSCRPAQRPHLPYASAHRLPPPGGSGPSRGCTLPRRAPPRARLSTCPVQQADKVRGYHRPAV